MEVNLNYHGLIRQIINRRMNEHKRALLKKNTPQDVNQEWIMLQDLSQPTTNNNRQQQPLRNDYGYARLDENSNRQKKYVDHASHHMQKIEQIPKETSFNPNVITINGDTFKKVESGQQQMREKPKGESKGKKAKVPTMQVACYYCTCVQTVPATSELFTCGRCASQNKCTPLYRIFICGTCQAKVCYVTGTSDLIRCTRCSAINKVPLGHGNPYEVDFRKASSLDNMERETEQYKEEFLDISQNGLEEENIRKDEFSGYLREK